MTDARLAPLPRWRTRAGRRVAAAGAAVLLVGALIGVHVLSHAATTTANAWRLLGTAPLTPRTNAVAAKVDGKLVVFGGRRVLGCPPGAACPVPGYRHDGAVYDPGSRSWTRMARPPRGTLGWPCATDRTTLIVTTYHWPIGLAAYHVDTNTWTRFPPPPEPLYGDETLAAGGRYAYVEDGGGALRGARDRSRVERVNLVTGRWDLMPIDDNRPRLGVRRLFMTPAGLLVAGLDTNDVNFRVQAELLHRHRWHRLPSPGLRAPNYVFAWTGRHLVAAFPTFGGAGSALDPGTGTWDTLASQHALGGDGWWESSFSTRGPRILLDGVIFNADTGRTVVLGQPGGVSSQASGTLVRGGVYALDSESRLWWQPF